MSSWCPLRCQLLVCLTSMYITISNICPGQAMEAVDGRRPPFPPHRSSSSSGDTRDTDTQAPSSGESSPSGKSKGFPLFSCPDKNKVNFIPRGSAFCPVKLLCSSLFSPISPSFHGNSGHTTQVTPTQPTVPPAMFSASTERSVDLSGGLKANGSTGSQNADAGDGSAHVVLTSWSSGIHDQNTYK
ncbi:hypothetical protein GOODEAATRI_013529 [Goodea atripinnis]|uniref:Uncharacterized protein n=1 Tax=Goodea atripinnis TaxID=208336 RepID=A0ABV0PXR7_9TELE